MNLKEMRRTIQKITFPINNNTAQKYEVLGSIFTIDNNEIRGKIERIVLDKESKTITIQFFEI